MADIDNTSGAKARTIISKEQIPAFNLFIQNSIVKNWNRNALTDFQGVTLQFHDVARKVEKLHIIFENSGIEKGDKIALCGRNSAHWATALIATLTYGAVAVPLLHEFTAEQIHNCVNHSDAKLLFVGDYVSTVIKADKMPNLLGIINLPDFSLHTCRSEQLENTRENLNALFGKKFPMSFTGDDIVYYQNTDPDDLALINYTSGTTGKPKGVMVPYRAIWNNTDFAMEVMGKTMYPGDAHVSMLPLAHMFGLAFDLLFPFSVGAHIHFLGRIPSPQIVTKAFATARPKLVISVPLVIEKIITKKVFPKLHTNRMRMLMHTPVISKKIKEKIRTGVMNVFGGNFYELILGGAALNREVEEFLRDMKIAYCVGYGATECAPLIAYTHWMDMKPGSCGKMINNMEICIDSNDPSNLPGEILVKGFNVMLGYYKEPELTREVLDENGWYHTGDLGVIDDDGFIFIKGRIKNMLLSSNGQNIYPEEIEEKLNSMPYVLESVVVQREDKLVALVYPDFEEMKTANLEFNNLSVFMEDNRNKLNGELPAYSKISKIVLRDTEFEKTAKKSIRRFLYK